MWSSSCRSRAARGGACIGATGPEREAASTSATASPEPPARPATRCGPRSGARSDSPTSRGTRRRCGCGSRLKDRAEAGGGKALARPRLNHAGGTMREKSAAKTKPVSERQLLEAEDGLIRLLHAKRFPREWIEHHAPEAMAQARTDFAARLAAKKPVDATVGLLVVIAYRRALKILRSEQSSPPPTSIESFFHLADDSVPTPEEEAIGHDREERVAKAMSHLPEREQRLMSLVYVGGLLETGNAAALGGAGRTAGGVCGALVVACLAGAASGVVDPGGGALGAGHAVPQHEVSSSSSASRANAHLEDAKSEVAEVLAKPQIERAEQSANPRAAGGTSRTGRRRGTQTASAAPLATTRQTVEEFGVERSTGDEAASQSGSPAVENAPLSPSTSPREDRSSPESSERSTTTSTTGANSEFGM